MRTGSDPRSAGPVVETLPAILFDNVSVRYRIPRERLSGIKEFTIRWLQRRIAYEDFWAVSNVSFSVNPGEVFGIVGRNGAGKSTLLKVMAQVLKPIQGRVVMRGSLAPLLELGGGFHPELTGRENVYMNMALLGHSRVYTDELFDSIVDFAEFREFIDAPLRTYSTGMVARLGFAVATCSRPDILLVDEILSVGDSQFQQKCLERMYEFQNQGTTIVIVSHGLGALETLCERALLLEKGQIKMIGPAEQVIQAYIAEDKPLIVETVEPVDRVLPPEPRPLPAPAIHAESVSLDEIGGIYPTQEIFDPAQGSVTVWIKIQSSSIPKDAVIFHTDDSRFVLYVSLEYSIQQKRYMRKLVARAGGNRRVIDTYYGTSEFPEVGISIEEEDIPKKYILEKDRWYLAAMTWKGSPSGTVHLYIDGVHVGEKQFDPSHDRGDEPARSISIGLRPAVWTGEIVHESDGNIKELRPNTLMWIGEGGIDIKELNLYRRALNPDEIRKLVEQGSTVLPLPDG